MKSVTAFSCAILISLASWIIAADPPAGAPQHATVADILDQHIVEFQTDGTLDAALDSIREKYHLNIIVNWHGLEESGITPGANVKVHLWDVSVSRVIDVLFAMVHDEPGISLGVDGEVVTIGVIGDLHNWHGLVEVYDVRDLLDAAVARRKLDPNLQLTTDQVEKEEEEKLVQLIESMVEADTWNDNGGLGSIKCWSGRVFIRQLPAQHRHVKALLEKIRAEEKKTANDPAARA